MSGRRSLDLAVRDLRDGLNRVASLLGSSLSANGGEDDDGERVTHVDGGVCLCGKIEVVLIGWEERERVWRLQRESEGQEAKRRDASSRELEWLCGRRSSLAE